jgi:hypothetical protein
LPYRDGEAGENGFTNKEMAEVQLGHLKSGIHLADWLTYMAKL